MDFFDMLKQMADENADKEAANGLLIEALSTPERLRELGARYLEPTNHKVGDLVQWKPGLKNTKFPDYGTPAVIIELNPGGHKTDMPSGSQYYCEPVTIRIAIITHNGDFDGFWMDGARFESWKSE